MTAFLVNPGKSRRGRRKLTGAAKAAFLARMAKGRKKHSTGGVATMAVTKRRKRNAPRKRRRSPARAVAMKSNAPVRRTRRRRNPPKTHRRRYRRNPGLLSSGRGVVGVIKSGVMDGALVLAGETVQNKAVQAISAAIPSFGSTTGALMLRGAAINIGVATAGSLMAKKVVPTQARMITAGLFARAIANCLAGTPLATLLSDYPAAVLGGYRRRPMGAYPALPAMGAYPQVGAMGAYPGVAFGNVPAGSNTACGVS